MNDWRNARIEEARAWVDNLLSGNGFGNDYTNEELDQWALEMVAVFEKAHTLTDNEREAHARIVAVLAGAGLATHPEVQRDLHTLAVGFRRTEVPEPSAERQKNAEEHFHIWSEMPCSCKDDDEFNLGDSPMNEKALAPSKDERDAAWLRFARTTEGFRVSDWAASAAFDAGWKARSEVPEPQGEPSDAQVDAAWAVIGGHRVLRETVRAALRAAMSLREGGVR